MRLLFTGAAVPNWGPGRRLKLLETAQQLLAVRPDDQPATLLKASALVDLDRGREAEAAIQMLKIHMEEVPELKAGVHGALQGYLSVVDS